MTYPTSLDSFAAAKSQVSPRARNIAYTKMVDAMKAVQLGLGLNFGKRPVTTKTADYTVTTADYTVIGDTTSGNKVFTLPTAASASGYTFVFKKIVSANTLTIDGAGSETIDGATTKVLSTQWTSVTIHSNGTAWFIIAAV